MGVSSMICVGYFNLIHVMQIFPAGPLSQSHVAHVGSRRFCTRTNRREHTGDRNDGTKSSGQQDDGERQSCGRSGTF
jgi:hypothetical protein